MLDLRLWPILTFVLKQAENSSYPIEQKRAIQTHQSTSFKIEPLCGINISVYGPYCVGNSFFRPYNWRIHQRTATYLTFVNIRNSGLNRHRAW